MYLDIVISNAFNLNKYFFFSFSFLYLVRHAMLSTRARGPCNANEQKLVAPRVRQSMLSCYSSVLPTQEDQLKG